MYCWMIINCCTCIKYLATFYHCFEFIILSIHWIQRCTCKLVDWKHCDFKFPMRFNSAWVTLLTLCSACIMSICIFGWFSIPFRGQDFGYQYSSSWSVLLFFYTFRPFLQFCFVYIFNQFCICSFMHRIFWSFHDIFSELVPQSSNWQFKQGISYPLGYLIKLG